jgi:hypothetical protein
MPSNTHERGLRNDPNRNQPLTGPRAQLGEQTYGRSPASGPAPTTAGHHSHDFLNKLDPRVDSTHDAQAMPQQQHSTKSNIPEGTYGPHHSRVANALDPRVDSDLDSTRTGAGAGAGMGPGGGWVGGGGGEVPARAGVAQGTGMGMHSAPGYENAGQRTGVPAAGRASGAYAQQQPQAQTHGVMMGEGVGGPHHQPAGAAGAGGFGPHKSSLMNKLDPRVDSKTGMTKDSSGTTKGSSGGPGWAKY